MDRRFPAGAGPVGDDRPRTDQPDRHQGRALQPQPRRGVSVAGRMDAARSRKPQRHARRRTAGSGRLHPAAGRHHSHRQFATGVRARSVARRFPIRARVLRHAQARRSKRRSTTHARPPRRRQRARRRTSRRRSRIAAGRRRFLEPPEEEADDVALPKVGRAAANLCRLAFELAKATDVDVAGQRGARRACSKARRSTPAPCCCCRAMPSAKPHGRRPGSRRVAQRFGAAVSSRVARFWRRRCCAKARRCWPAT